MRFLRMNATFGALQRRELSFAPGLNIIEAPNESGKSTLAAFLRVMLYGIPTRDRGALADKNRFQPWSGAAMQGTLTIESEALGTVTLTRDTVRPGSPMGRFSAVYTGTGNPVAALTAADCGETLLGVPREVYERSAFIRQSGLAVDANAELERRIAALITTGEEGISYTEAADALRKQRNARRANARRGTIPSLEREIADDADTLTALRSLQAERDAAEQEAEALQQRETALRDDLHTHEIADIQERYRAREYAKRDADAAERREKQFRAMLAEMRVPPREVLAENRLRLDALDELTLQLEDAAQEQAGADAALQAHRSAGKPRTFSATGTLWLSLCAGCAALSAASFAGVLPSKLQSVIFSLPVFAVLFGLALRRRLAERRAYDSRTNELSAAVRDAEAVCAALRGQRERTLAQIYADIPAGDETSVRAYIIENLERRDTLIQLERDAADKRLAYEGYPPVNLKGIPAYPVTRPAQPPEVLRGELAHIAEQRVAARSRADVASGRLAAIGDALALEAALAHKRERLAEAQAEYDALTLAADALDRANTALQNRFSPALGKRAAAYFSALTGGRYDAVALDRSFRALATERGGGVSRDAALLSQGAGEQLYLAVRLAICDMVLPKEISVPLVLDDALTDFDDTRCAAALELLAQIARERQILLLTCQHREATYLAGRDNVHIISL